MIFSITLFSNAFANGKLMCSNCGSYYHTESQCYSEDYSNNSSNYDSDSDDYDDDDDY